MPGCGGTIRLPSLIGLARAIELILAGDNILAAEALNIGLIDAIIDKKELLKSAEKMIQQGWPPRRHQGNQKL